MFHFTIFALEGFHGSMEMTSQFIAATCLVSESIHECSLLDSKDRSAVSLC